MCLVDCCDGLSIVMHQRHPKARVAHRCGECGRMIQPGETYMVERTVFDGQAKTHKTCRHCEAVRSWLSSECGGFVYGAVSEDIDGHSWHGYGIRVSMMAVGIQRKWTRKDGRMWPLPRLPRVSGHDQMRDHALKG